MADLRNRAQKLTEETRYVYFPLHMQPEMTTSEIGGIYVDQLLSIERLARRLPSDIKIVVRENPKQTAYQRPHIFFERLADIPNALLVPSDRDTYTDTGIRVRSHRDRHCGMGGNQPGEAHPGVWESLVQSLPGVSKYSSILDFRAITGCHVDKHEVECA